MTEDHVHDVVFVGAGMSAAVAAARLAEAGLDVVILEAGPPTRDRREQRWEFVDRFMRAPIKTVSSPYTDPPEAPHPVMANIHPSYYVQKGEVPFKSTYERLEGGTSWHWQGTAMRHVPNDFRLASSYGHGRDWPIDYNDLEPWYGEAEHEIGVSGDTEAWRAYMARFGARFEGSYPMPGIWLTYLDRSIARAVRGKTFGGLPVEVIQTPQARNTVAYQGRPACEGNTTCIPICPIQAKYDSTYHLARASKAGARIVTRAVVHEVEIGAHRRVSAVRYLDWEKQTHRVRGRLFVLAAHAVETPKILLMSTGANTPKGGVANSSDQVGRNLMDHNVAMSYALAKDPVYPFRGPVATSGIESLRDGAFRKERAAFRLEINNNGWTWPNGSPYGDIQQLTAKGYFGKALADEIRERLTRQLTLSSLVETLPLPQNRVRLASETDALGIPRPAMFYSIDDYTKAGMDEAIDAHELVFQSMECSEIHLNRFASDGSYLFYGAGHIMGTCIMGGDPGSSVVDADLRTHDHENLFVLGSSTFPSAATANPTLTIIALALRAAKTIAMQAKAG